jgi:hypothetical protein
MKHPGDPEMSGCTCKPIDPLDSLGWRAGQIHRLLMPWTTQRSLSNAIRRLSSMRRHNTYVSPH